MSPLENQEYCLLFYNEKIIMHGVPFPQAGSVAPLNFDRSQKLYYSIFQETKTYAHTYFRS